MTARPTRLITLLGVLAVACSPGTAATTTGQPTTTTTQATTTSTVVSTTTTTAPSTTSTAPQPDQTVEVLLQPFSQLGPEWAEVLLPYGEGVEQLGTAPGGEGLMLGPEYGTQTSDGTWWILDAAKQRVAKFGPDGRFSEELPLPTDVLVNGQYFQFQMPQALDDGSIAATGFRSETTSALLRIVGDEITSVEFPGAMSWVTTDGRYLYGAEFETGQPHRLDPNNPTAEPVDAFLARDGSRFTVSLDGDVLQVGLPDAGLTRTLLLRYSEDPEVAAFGGIEVETGSDGTIFILIYGAPESDEVLGIGGFLSISPNGVVGEVEPIREPFSPADPGSPAHLGTTSGSPDPWLMMIDEDGVRIYTRGG